MKYIITTFSLLSLTVLAGCQSDLALVNFNAGITETLNENEIAEVVVANANDNANVNSNTNVEENTNTESVSDGSTEQESEIDTSDWLTYTNEEYGFSFRYPKEWDLLVGSDFTDKFGIPQSLVIGGLDHKPTYENIRGIFAVYFNVNPVEKSTSLTDWFDSTDSYTSKEELNNQNSEFSPSIDSVKVSIDGIDAIDQITSGEGGGMREIFIKKGDHVYIFTISVNGDEPNYRNPSLNSNINGNNVLESFNQLLETINFQ